MRPEDPLPAPYRVLLAAISRLVPRHGRASWRREWEAEVSYAWARRDGAPSRVRLFVRVGLSVFDALWLRWEEVGMERWIGELRQVVRGLQRSPGFTAVSVATLALGIGATTAVFAVVEGVLLRPLPYPESERVVSLMHTAPGAGIDRLGAGAAHFLLYRDDGRAVEAVALYRGTEVTVQGASGPERVPMLQTTSTLPEVLGTDALRGRWFTAEEDAPGGPRTLLLSESYWRSRYGADPTVIGETLTVDGEPWRIVGVAPASVSLLGSDAVAVVPGRLDPAAVEVGAFSAFGLARLAPGASLDGAERELLALLRNRLPERWPGTAMTAASMEEAGLAPVLIPFRDALLGEIRATLWVVLGTVAGVLLIACANVANLFLVRREARLRETAVRAAMGAGRAHLLRHFLLESLVLGAAGGVVGLLLAGYGVDALLALAPADLPRQAEIGLAPAVIGFTALVSLLAVLVAGLLPGLGALRTRPAAVLRGSGRGTTGGGRLGLRNALVVAQVALALVLLVGSALLMRTFQALREVDPGVRAEGVLTFAVPAPSYEYASAEEVIAFGRAVRDRLEALPGVTAAGAIDRLPLQGPEAGDGVFIEDWPVAPDALPRAAYPPRQVTPGYFRAMGIPLIEGRAFTAADQTDSTAAVIVSRAFAERWWPDASPLGRRIKSSDRAAPWYEIVGVVGDVRGELSEPSNGLLYYPVRSWAQPAGGVRRLLSWAVHTDGAPEALVPAVRRALAEVNPGIPIARVGTMRSIVERATARTSFAMVIIGLAAAVALFLGSIGIYGVVSYVVGRRTREIGVRMALGEKPGAVLRRVVRGGLLLTAAGAAIGLVTALALSSLVAGLLYGVSATDPVTYGAVTALVVGVAALASWVPARRAAGVDPARALRAE